MEPDAIGRILEEHKSMRSELRKLLCCSLEDARALLEANPDFARSKDDEGWTPLHRAAQGGHVAFAELLLAHGAEVDAKTPGGNTPLCMAATAAQHALAARSISGLPTRPEDTIAIARLLLAHGADVMNVQYDDVQRYLKRFV